MKNLLITLCLVCISTLCMAQIPEPPLSNRSADIYLRDTNIVVAVIPANTGQLDSFATVSTRFPTFATSDGYITTQQIENAWNNRQYQNSEYIVNGLVYKLSRTKHFALLNNRFGLALIQKGRIYEPQMAEKTDIEKVYWYYKYAIDSSFAIEQLNSYQPYRVLLDSLNKSEAQGTGGINSTEL